MKSPIAFGAAAALFLMAAPLSLAQVSPPATTPPATTPATPETQPAPVTPATPATPAAPSATPATPATPAAPDAASAPQSGEVAGNAACRTRKDVGEQCSCLSAPTDFGTSQQSDTGAHNVCVVPN